MDFSFLFINFATSIKMKKAHSLYDVILATGFGSGFWPWGPGTAGSVLAAILWCAYAIPISTRSGAMVMPDNALVQIVTMLLVVVFTILSIAPINRLEKVWGEDPSKVVVDEMVGIWITLLAVPQEWEWWHVILALLLFRFFDIVKPLGVRWIDNNVKGGWGVMLDDILAGIYGAIVLWWVSQFVHV